MKRSKIVGIFNYFSSIEDQKISPKGAYASSKNISLAKNEIEALQKAQAKAEMPEGVRECELKRIELCKKYCNKDEDGELIIINEKFDIPLDAQNKIDKELVKLQEEHKDAFEEKEKIEKEFSELLEEDVKIEFHKIKLEDLPERISPAEIKIIEDLIIGE